MSDWSVFLNDISDAFGYNTQVGQYRISGIEADGIDGFTFSRTKEHEINLSSSITDYPVEDGNVSQNVITLNPERIKLTGVVAEVVYGKNLLTQIVDTLSSSLLPVSVLSPSLGAATQKVLNQLGSELGELAKLTEQAKNIVKSAAGFAAAMGVDVPAGLLMTIQEKAYYYLEACWKSRKLLKIETPWRYFEDMVIEELRFVQTETSTSYSDVEVTLKRVIAPQTRQSERTTLKQGRANTGLENTKKQAASTGKRLIEQSKNIKEEIVDATKKVIKDSSDGSSFSILDVMTARAKVE